MVNKQHILPVWALNRAIRLFNQWTTRVAVEKLPPNEQGKVLIRMIADALENACQNKPED